MPVRHFLAAPAVFAATSLACAAGVTYDVSIVPVQSTLNSLTSVGAPIVGSFIGNYDAVTNPTGTQTLPGLFGGSGNNPIGYTAAFSGTGDVATNPVGGFSMSVDTRALTFSIDGLSVDLLGGNTGAIDTTIEITYSSFHTVNPNAIFPGGFTLPIPIAGGAIEELSATQTGGAVPGVLVPAGRSVYTFAAAVPVDLLATITFNGQVLGGVPVALVLPVVGEIDFGGESVVVTLTAAQTLSQDQPIDPPAEFADQPLDLPTVLPPGGTAHLLFSGSIANVSVDAELALDLVADAVPASNPADLDGDGEVGPTDLAILLGAWNTNGPGDLNGDGVVGAADLALLLGAWG